MTLVPLPVTGHPEYHKIDTLFERDAKFIVDPSKLKSPVLATISKWDVTEKIDGTNIRVMLSVDGELTFGGRSGNAMIPADLVTYLNRTFAVERMREVFWRDGQPVSAVLYGEGYGAGIQKGGCYRKDKAFRLFDVLVDGKWWLDWANTCDVAGRLEIKTVPWLGQWSFPYLVERVQEGIRSLVAEEDTGSLAVMAEGAVARPIEPLFDKRGNRIIIKLKTKDFGKASAGAA